ncbi:MAG TPA: zinc-ribbon domain-containing protein, partial [Polyangiaceae bacterium]|nr:zinc-ribbon domain-containing protein [Polyangiaceae bacterium]
MITCPKCGKENQDHYKFCLGCGAELPRGGAAAKPFTSNTPPHGIPAAQARPVAASAPEVGAPPPPAAPAQAAPRPATPGTPSGAPPAAAAAPNMVSCPQCGHSNVLGNRFCASCGYNLSALSGAQAVPAVAAPAAVAAGGARSITLTALRADGTEAGQYRLPD